MPGAREAAPPASGATRVTPGARSCAGDRAGAAGEGPSRGRRRGRAREGRRRGRAGARKGAPPGPGKDAAGGPRRIFELNRLPYDGYPRDDAVVAVDRRGKKRVAMAEEGPLQEAAPATKKRKIVLEKDRQDVARKHRVVVRIGDPFREAKKARGGAKSAAPSSSKPVPAAKPAAPGPSKSSAGAKAAASGAGKPPSGEPAKG
eukprot:XP_020407705.1 damage suppressor protein-like [Zea mays]